MEMDDNSKADETEQSGESSKPQDDPQQQQQQQEDNADVPPAELSTQTQETGMFVSLFVSLESFKLTGLTDFIQIHSLVFKLENFFILFTS